MNFDRLRSSDSASTSFTPSPPSRTTRLHHAPCARSILASLPSEGGTAARITYAQGTPHSQLTSCRSAAPSARHGWLPDDGPTGHNAATSMPALSPKRRFSKDSSPPPHEESLPGTGSAASLPVQRHQRTLHLPAQTPPSAVNPPAPPTSPAVERLQLAAVCGETSRWEGRAGRSGFWSPSSLFHKLPEVAADEVRHLMKSPL